MSKSHIESISMVIPQLSIKGPFKLVQKLLFLIDLTLKVIGQGQILTRMANPI